MKKFLSILLAMLMVLSMVAVASAEGPVEITITHNWGTGANFEEMNYLVDKFNAENEGKIHVTAEYVSGGYADVLSKFNVGYSVNENPAVSIIDACMTLDELRKNTMVNLTKYAAENDPEYDGGFVDAMLLFSTDPATGDVYSLPYARSTQIMYVNLDLVKEAIGEELMPESWDDIEKICEAWMAKTGKPGYGHPIGGGFYSWYITTMAKGEYFNKAGDGACVYVNNAWEIALETWRKYIDNGWFDAPSVVSGGNGYWEHFQAGELPVAFTSSGSLTGAITKAQEAGFKLGVGVLPGGLQEDGSVFRRVYTGGANLMIANNKTAEETAAAWEFVKFMTSKETNIHHSFNTGYVLSHIGCEDDAYTQEQWAAEPFKKVGYDQMAYVNETYVSAYTQEIDLEVVDTLKAFVYDGISVKDTLDALVMTMEEIMPNGVVESYE